MYSEYYGIKCFKSWPRTYTCIAMVETSGTSGQQDILNICISIRKQIDVVVFM